MQIIHPEMLEKSRERWDNWFDHCLDNGPLIYIDAPLETPREPLLEIIKPGSIKEQWVDVEYRVRETRNLFSLTWFGGDSVPSWFVNLGPGSVAAYLGPEPEYTRHSLWFNELGKNSLEDIHRQIRYREDNPFWELTKGLTRRSLEMARGDYLISLTDLGADLDILDSLRGTNNLLMDLIENPEMVCRCCGKIGRLWMRYFRENNRILENAGQNGYTCWMPCWSSKPWTVLQCDLSVMISPEMFARFALPELKEKSNAIPHTIYHLDGPGEWKHLDLILSVPGIDAVQYVTLPGDPPNESVHWLPFYKRITDAGKNIFIIVKDPEQIIELSRNLPPEQLAFHISMNSVGGAEDFLRRFAR